MNKKRLKPTLRGRGPREGETWLDLLERKEKPVDNRVLIVGEKYEIGEVVASPVSHQACLVYKVEQVCRYQFIELIDPKIDNTRGIEMARIERYLMFSSDQDRWRPELVDVEHIPNTCREFRDCLEFIERHKYERSCEKDDL